jgi:hypothetical protein
LTQTQLNKIISIGLHTAVYLAFFLVQLFFNFEIASNAKMSFQKTSSLSIAKSSGASVRHSAAHPDKKTTFRLNKRFQPQAAPVCVLFTTKAPVRYIPSKFTNAYYGYFIPVVTPCSLSLRGPPVVG